MYLLDDDDTLRDVLVALFCASGHVCAAASSFGAFTDIVRDPTDADVAILDINLGPNQPSGIDAYAWLRAHTFPGRIVFLTGHGRAHPLVQEAQRIGAARILEKPIAAEVLLGLAENRPP